MYSQSTTSFFIMLTVLISSFLTKSTTIMAKVSSTVSSTRSNVFGSMRSYCGSTSAGSSSSKSSSSSSSSNIIAFVTVTNTHHHQHQPLSSSSAVTTTRRQYHHQHHQQQQLRLHRLQRQQQPSRSSSFGRLYSSSSSSSSGSSNSGDSNNSDSDDHVHVHVHHNVHHNVEAKAKKVLEVQHQEEKIIITPLPLPSQSQSQSQSQQRQRILKQFQSNVNDNDNDNANSEKQKQKQKQIIAIAIDTLDWLENVVIGYNLCPFAEKSFLSKNNQLNIDVVIGSNQTEILSRVLNECLRLKDNPGTALIVCPNLYPKNFIAYLEVLNILTDGILIDNNLMNDIQIAPFHPLFIFGDNSNSNNNNNNNNNLDDNDNIENYTNRSPYPIFHILREEEVSYAVDVLDGDDSIVWKRNIDFLNKLQYMFSENNTDINTDINTDNLNTDINTDINKTELLRSVFLKGKANDANVSSSSGNKCPISIIKQYEERIQSILKEFRGR